MNLVSTSQTLRIVLGEAKTTNDCDIVANYADIGFNAFLLGANDVVSNGTTAVTVVASPSSSLQRQVKEIRLHNNDTVGHTVTLQLHYGSTTRVLQQNVVPAGGDFLYTPDGSLTTIEPAIEWNAGTVDVVGVGLNLASGTLSNSGIVSLVAGTNVTISGGDTIAAATSVVAGSGISVTSGNTVANTGILSLAAGTGIAVSGNTITATGAPSLTAGAGVASVSGGTIVADYQSGTLTTFHGATLSGGTLTTDWGLGAVTVAGTGITVSGGTISSTGGGGGTWNAGTVNAIDSTNLVINSNTLGIATGPTIQVVSGTTAMVVNSNTSTSIPTLAGSSGLLIVGKDNASGGSEVIAVAGTLTGTSGVANIIVGRMNGSLASPSALNADDRIFGYAIRGYATSYVGAMAIWGVAAGSTWSGTGHEVYQTWYTIPSGSNTAAERMRLLSGGALVIGGTTVSASEKLHVQGDVVVTGTETVAGIIINAGSVITAIGSGLTNTSGTLSASGTTLTASHALAINSGTITDQNQGTITLSGTTTGTINPAGVDSVLVNVGTAAGTIAVSPGFQGQRLRVEIKQGATPHTATFTSTVSFGTTVTSYTATNTASARDLVQMFCVDGTHWALSAVSQGFTI